jgi:hypothetical protein
MGCELRMTELKKSVGVGCANQKCGKKAYEKSWNGVRNSNRPLNKLFCAIVRMSGVRKGKDNNVKKDLEAYHRQHLCRGLPKMLSPCLQLTAKHRRNRFSRILLAMHMNCLNQSNSALPFGEH